MALRDTKHSITIYGEGDPKLRETKHSITIYAFIIQEILVDNIADNLNNWQDDVQFQITAVLNEQFTDSFELLDTHEVFLLGLLSNATADDLNNWADAVTTGILISLLEELNDSFTLTDAHFFSFTDVILKELSDTLQFLDALEHQLFVNIYETFSDNFTLSDARSELLTYIANLVDNLDAWNDAHIHYLIVPIFVNDSMANWGDSVTIQNEFVARLSDRLVLADNLRTFLDTTINFSDQLVFTDALQTLLEYITSFIDSMEQLDAITFNDSAIIPITLSDSLNNWNDIVTFRNSDATDDYYRRYLNDRLFKVGEMIHFFGDRFTVRDSVEAELLAA